MQFPDRNVRFPILTATACLICVVIFLGINFQGSMSDDALRRWGLYPDREIFAGAYWAMITQAFVHIQPIHLLFNMFWLWALGGAFELRFGPAIWIAFVIGAAFVSSGIQLVSGSAGIGMSGVGYALFGFGWLARSRLPEFRRIVTDQTVMMFVGWGILCIITTQLGVMNIANLAHGAGFVIGAGLGLVFASDQGRMLPAIAVAAISAASFVPLFFNPRSVDWTALQAAKARSRAQYGEAERLYMRGMALGANPSWGWYNLALVYGAQGRTDDLVRAIEELRRFDPEGAQELEEAFLRPESSPQP